MEISNKLDIKGQVLFHPMRFYIGNKLYSEKDILNILQEQKEIYKSLKLSCDLPQINSDTKIFTGIDTNTIVHLYNQVCGFYTNNSSESMIYIEYLNGYVLIDSSNKNQVKYSFSTDLDHYINISEDIFNDLVTKKNYTYIQTATKFSTEYKLIKTEEDDSLCLN